MPDGIYPFRPAGEEAVLVARERLAKAGKVTQEHWSEPSQLGMLNAKVIPARAELSGMQVRSFELHGDAKGPETILPRLTELGDDFAAGWAGQYAGHGGVSVERRLDVWHFGVDWPTAPEGFSAYFERVAEALRLPVKVLRHPDGRHETQHADGLPVLGGSSQLYVLCRVPGATLDDMLRLIAEHAALLGKPGKPRGTWIASVAPKLDPARVEALYDTFRTFGTGGYREEYKFSLTGLEHLAKLQALCVKAGDTMQIKWCTLDTPPGWTAWLELALKKAGIVPELHMGRPDSGAVSRKDVNRWLADVAEWTGFERGK